MKKAPDIYGSSEQKITKTFTVKFEQSIYRSGIVFIEVFVVRLQNVVFGFGIHHFRKRIQFD